MGSFFFEIFLHLFFWFKKNVYIYTIIKNKYMEYIIYNHTRTSKGIDINNANLEVDNGGSYQDYDLKHLTDKGYYSKKALYVDFDYEVLYDDGLECLKVSKETAERLLNEYTGLKGKIFRTAHDRHHTDKVEGLKAICSVIHDPHDIG